MKRKPLIRAISHEGQNKVSIGFRAAKILFDRIVLHVGNHSRHTNVVPPLDDAGGHAWLDQAADPKVSSIWMLKKRSYAWFCR